MVYGGHLHSLVQHQFDVLQYLGGALSLQNSQLTPSTRMVVALAPAADARIGLSLYAKALEYSVGLLGPSRAMETGILRSCAASIHQHHTSNIIQQK